MDLLVLDDFLGPWNCSGAELLLIGVRLSCSGKYRISIPVAGAGHAVPGWTRSNDAYCL